MGATEQAEELSSTPRWAVRILGQVSGTMLMMGIFVLIFSSIALYAVGQIYPAAIPFLCLAVVGYTISLVGVTVGNDDAMTLSESMEIVSEMTPSERRIYFVTLVISFVGILGVPISIFGAVSALLANGFAIPFVAMALATFGPTVDGWVGRRTGISIAIVGLKAAVVFMEIMAILSRISPQIPRSAGGSVHQFVD